MLSIFRHWLVMLCVMLPMTAMAQSVSFVDLTGKPVNLSDYKGKWVVVNYWATWCPPCVKEIPELVAFQEAHAAKKDAVVLGVNHQEGDVAAVKQFADDRFVNYPIVRSAGKLSNGTPFGVLRGLPTTYMITPEGEAVAAHTGMVNQAMLEKFIQDYPKK